jgi:hypothetical protein
MPAAGEAMKREIADHDLDIVMAFWVSQYQFPEGQRIVDYEYFIDATKRRVVFRLRIDCSTPQPCAAKENK